MTTVFQRKTCPRAVVYSSDSNASISAEKVNAQASWQLDNKENYSQVNVDQRFASQRPLVHSKSIPTRKAAEASILSPSQVHYEERQSKHIPFSSLVRSPINDNEKEVESIFSKIRHGRLDKIRQYFEDGILEPTLTDKNGNSMLHICAQNNQKPLAALLIKKGMTALDYCELYQFHDLKTWLEKKYQQQVLRDNLPAM